MGKFILTNKAVDDLTAIWDYTFEFWLESQADKYYLQLVSDFQFLANNPDVGRNYIEIDMEVFGFKSGEHLIFYRKLAQNEIEVTRILHAQMDLKNRIKE
jgi:toxin ParE1/3/4